VCIGTGRQVSAGICTDEKLWLSLIDLWPLGWHFYMHPGYPRSVSVPCIHPGGDRSVALGNTVSTKPSSGSPELHMHTLLPVTKKKTSTYKQVVNDIEEGMWVSGYIIPLPPHPISFLFSSLPSTHSLIHSYSACIRSPFLPALQSFSTGLVPASLISPR